MRVVPIGTMDSAFGINDPKDCAIDPSGRLLVLDGIGPDLVVLDPGGHFLDRWPVSGATSRPFFRPTRVTTTGLAILLLDPAERLIVRLDLNGQFQAEALDLSDVFATENLGFVEPADLTADSAGQLYVSDREGNRILAFDTFGQYRFALGGFGAGGWQLRVPTSIDVDRSGHVVVVDSGNKRLQVFDSFGAFFRELRLPATATGEAASPIAVGTHPDGYVLVTDDRDRLVVLDDRGGVLATSPLADGIAITSHPTGRVFVLALGPPRVESLELEAL